MRALKDRVKKLEDQATPASDLAPRQIVLVPVGGSAEAELAKLAAAGADEGGEKIFVHLVASNNGRLA